MTCFETAATAAITLALTAATLVPQAAASERPSAPSDWSRVMRLEPGTELIVIQRGSGASKYRAAFAGTLNLVVLRFTNPKPPRRVLHALDLVGPNWPAIRAGVAFASDSVLVSRDGIFDAGVKFGDVVELLREDVIEIQTPGPRGSTRGAKVGAAVGGVVGLFSFVSISFKPCGASCSDEAAAAILSIVGFPIAGGLLGYYGGQSSGPVTIYRAPDPGPSVLDEVTWRRIRQALPPSLRGGDGQ